VFERLAQNARLDRGNIGGNVGQLRHGYQLADSAGKLQALAACV
jgi:hypothetical protein